MKLRKVFLILVIFGVWTPASSQNTNLLKNPGGDEGSEHWRAFHDAKVEQCPTGERCFVLRSGGYFTQEVAIPKEAGGQYAVLIGRAKSETRTAVPSLHGYLMNSGNPSGGRIYAHLNGQQMTGSADSSLTWTHLWGVFRVKPGTGRISFFLQQLLQKDNGYTGDATTRFDDLGLYIFPTEQEARGLVSRTIPGAQFGPTRAIGRIPECWLPRVLKPSLYGIHLGTSLDDVVSLFPEAVNQPSVVSAVKSSKSSNQKGPINMVIGRIENENLKEVNLLAFKFHHDRLFSLTAETHSPLLERR